MENSNKRKNSNGLRRGVFVFLGLLLLTLLEYWVAITSGIAVPLMVLIMLGKAVLIIEYYMHLRSISDTEEGGH